MLQFAAFISIVLVLVSNPSWACQIVSVQAEKRVEGHRFQQVGVGWVVQERGAQSPYILTPAHVAADADRLTIFCGKKAIAAQLRAQSKTLDLSLLSVPADDVLKPLFSFLAGQRIAKHSNSEVQGAHIYYPTPSGELLNIKSINKWVDSPNHNLLGVGKAILSETTASRPGVSGSPLISADWNGRYAVLPVGMVLQSRTNFHNSLAIPIKEIWSALPVLAMGKDPWLRSSAQRPRVVYSYALKGFEGQVIGLGRTKSLFIGQKKVFSESCERSDSAEVSRWKMMGGGDWADDGGPGADWADDGGPGADWADDGSGRKAMSRHSGLPVHHQSVELYGVSQSTEFCDRQGLRISTGKTLAAIVDENKKIYRKTTTVADVFDLVQEHGRGFSKYAQKKGQFLEDEHLDYTALCNSDLLGSEHILTARYGTGLNAHLPGVAKDYTFYRTLLRPLQKGQQVSSAGVLCKPGKLNRLAFASESSKANEPTFMFVFEANSFVVGALRLGKCGIKVDSDQPTTRLNMWSAIYQGKEATIQMNFSPNGDEVFKISIMNISEKCQLQSQQGNPIWMYNYRMLRNSNKTQSGWMSLEQSSQVEFRFVSPQGCENGFHWTPEKGAVCN